MRSPQEDHDHDRVDDETTGAGQVVFAGNVGDAEDERGNKGAEERAPAADGDDNQEVDQEFQWKRRIEAEELCAKGAAQSGETRADGESHGKYSPDIDAETAGDGRVIDAGAEPAAEAR